MLQNINSVRARLPRRSRKGGAVVEYGMILGLVMTIAIAALMAFGGKTDEVFCQGGNALGQVTGQVDERCPIQLMDDGTTTGIGPNGFEDLYLALEEVEVRRVLLPVKNFDISGMDEVIVETDRADSVAACYELAGGQVTCATMMGTISAFDFPPNVVAVGYELLPVADVRIEMAQPISITLGSRENPSVNKTWNIHAYRPAVPNAFSPEFEFEDHEFLVGQVGEQTILKQLKGDFSQDDLLLEITPDEGAFGACAHDADKLAKKCGLLQEAGGSTLVKTDAKALGYQLYLPRDVRIPVSWPLSISLASTFDPENDVKTWDIVVSRPVGEAPAFPDMPFAEKEFEAGLEGWAYDMAPLDASYPSDLMIWMPPADAGLKACYKQAEDGPFICSPDAGQGEVKFTVPAGAYSFGYAVQLPEDVLVDFGRRAVFAITSVDYPDFSAEFDLAVTRPAFVAVFEPTFTFGDHVFPEGTVDWQSHLVEMTGAFNSNQTLVLPAGQEGVKLCVQATPESEPSCSAEGGDDPVEFNVPQDSFALGFALNLGESEFQPVSQAIQFELRNAKDARYSQAYALTASRPAAEIVFEPDAAAMVFTDIAYPEAAEGWQVPQLVALAGNFNTDLMLSMAGGAVDAGVCYTSAATGADPVCSDTALTTGQEFLVPKDATHIGFRVQLSENIYVAEDLSIAFELGSAETDVFAVPFAVRVTRPAVPVKFDPNLGFRDKVFAVGTTGEQAVMVPIEGEITTGLKITVPQVGFSLRACFSETAGDNPACSANAVNGEVVLDVPRNSAAIGYQVELPDDAHVDWGYDIAFAIESDADDTLNYDVVTAVSRETLPVSFAPTTIFEDIEFAPGTVGAQTVIKSLAGDITTGAVIRMPANGHPIAPCHRKTTSGAVHCAEDADAAERTTQAIWTKEESEAGLRIEGAGYRVVLPEDIHQDVDWEMTLRTESSYDRTVGKNYTVRIHRAAVPVIWSPDAMMQLPDAEFPVRATGDRDMMIPFAGEFTTRTDLTFGSTGYDIFPCYRETSSGDIECGASTQTGSATVALDPEWEAVGYRIELPSDLAQEVEKTVHVNLSSSYVPSLSSSQTFKVFREPAPVAFDPTVSFSSKTYTRGEIGWQEIMEPLSGNLTTDLELVAEAGKEMRLCVQDRLGGAVRCTTGEVRQAKIIDVPPTAYAIGVAVKLPENPLVEDNQSVAFSLRMKDYPSQSRTYNLSTHRVGLDIEFDTTTSFADQSFEVGESGWQQDMQPLVGSFSTPLEFVAQNPGSDLRICYQSAAGAQVFCDDPGNSHLDIDSSTYAIGYSVHVDDAEFEDVSRSVKLRLQSVDAETVGKDFSPTVSRPGRAVELPSNALFDAKTFEAGKTGYETVMAPLGGVGNTPMTYTLARTDFDARACIQRTGTSPVVCKDASALSGRQSYAIDKDTFAIGYRVKLPDDHFEIFERSLPLEIASDTVSSAVRSWNLSLKRNVRQPIMPAADLFSNQTFTPGSTGKHRVMAILDPKIDTRLSFRKRSSQGDVELCIQKSHDGDIVCVGEGIHQAIEIQDLDKSWYAVGYRFSFGDDPEPEIVRTISISLHSLDVPSAASGYNIGVTRLKMDAIMPDRMFFADVEYDEGDSGRKTELLPLGRTDIDLVLHKKPGQEGLEICHQNWDWNSGTIHCTDKDSIAVSKSQYAIGYRFTLNENIFEPVDMTFDLAVTARDGFSNRVDYSIDVDRPATRLVLPAGDLFSDVVLEEGEKETYTHMMPVDPSVNTSFSVIKAAGQPGLQLCRQTSETALPSCFGQDDGNEFSIDPSLEDYAIGYRIDVGSEFVPYDEDFGISIRSRDVETEEVSYDFTVSRAGRDIVMPPANFFADVEFDEGETGEGEILASFLDVSNTNLRIDVSGGHPGIHLCAKTGTTPANCGSKIAAGEPGGRDVTRSYDKIGFKLDLPDSIYADFDHTFTITLTSKESDAAIRSYPIRVHRPAVGINLPPQSLFTELNFEAGTTETQTIMRNIEGALNTKVFWHAPEGQPESVYACKKVEGEVEPICSKYHSKNQYSYAPAQVGVPLDVPEIGFRFDLPTDVFEEVDTTIQLVLSSEPDPEQKVIYNVRVRRPAVAIVLPPQSLFADLNFEAGTTGTQTIMRSIEGIMTSDAVLMAPEGQPKSVFACVTREGEVEPKCSKYHSKNQYSWAPAQVGVLETDRKIGFAFDLPEDVFEEVDTTIQLELSSKPDPEQKVIYNVRVRRPAAEVTLPSRDLFKDIDVEPGTLGQIVHTVNSHGASNTTVQMDVAQTSRVGINLCVNNPTGLSCRNGSTIDGVKTIYFAPTSNEIVFTIDLPKGIYKDFEEEIHVTLISTEDESQRYSHSFKVIRPAAEVSDDGLPKIIPGALSFVLDAQELAEIYVDSRKPFTIHWGDGTSTSRNSSSGYVPHDYDSLGSYRIQITGSNIVRFTTRNNSMLWLDQWGDVNLQSLKYTFSADRSLKRVPDHLPSTVWEAYGAFNDGANPTGLESWDVSKVTNMNSMFNDNPRYTGDLSGWCVSQISRLPSNFGAANATHPVWGTCP